MNVSTIADMIRADPKITEDVPAFLKKVNEQNITQVITTRDVIAEETKTFSFAELNGGEAMQADVDAAVAFLKAEPLQKEAQERLDKVAAAVASGEVLTTQDLIAKFSEPLPGK